MRLLILFMIVFFTSCSIYQYSAWSEEDGYVIIQLDEVDPTVEIYYAEITLESGSKIAIELGKPDSNKQFKIKNEFGKLNDIQIYTNKDVP